MKRVASLHLIEWGNIEVVAPDYFMRKSHPGYRDVCRLIAVQHLWNDKRLTDLLDAWIAADEGGVK